MKKVSWNCRICNPEGNEAGLVYEAMSDASRYPYCACRRAMLPTDEALVPKYWHRRGRWNGRCQAVTDRMNASLDIDGGDTSIVAVEWADDLPPIGSLLRLAWERGRLDGYRNCQARVMAHPEIMEDY